MFTFGTLTVDEREYTLEDAKQVVIARKFGLEDDFYGGRITHVGKTDSDVVLLMSDANTVIDTGAEDLSNISIETIRGLCNKRKFKIAHNTSRDKMIQMLGGGTVEKQRQNEECQTHDAQWNVDERFRNEKNDGQWEEEKPEKSQEKIDIC